MRKTEALKMNFPGPLHEGKLLKRYKRFFADLEYKGEVVTAHVPNTGSLKDCLETGNPCLFTISDDPKRKLKATLHFIKVGNSWVGVNTSLSNPLVWEAFQNKRFQHWKKFTEGQPEVSINNQSRMDFALWTKENGPPQGTKLSAKNIDQYRLHFVEVKNVTLAESHIAQFPDATTTRGQKHLTDLMELIKQGHSAEILFVVQRSDCDTFSPADGIDPVYGRLLREARAAGVAISCFATALENETIRLVPNSLKLKL